MDDTDSTKPTECGQLNSGTFQIHTLFYIFGTFCNGLTILMSVTFAFYIFPNSFIITAAVDRVCLHTINMNFVWSFVSFSQLTLSCNTNTYMNEWLIALFYSILVCHESFVLLVLFKMILESKLRNFNYALLRPELALFEVVSFD